MHVDALTIAQFRQQPSEVSYGPRFFTGILYLNDNFSGGETVFPKLSLKIKPKSGRLLLWSNTLAGSIDPDPKTAHAGLPVLEGEQNILSLWLTSRYGSNLLKIRLFQLEQQKLGKF